LPDFREKQAKLGVETIESSAIDEQLASALQTLLLREGALILPGISALSYDDLQCINRLRMHALDQDASARAF
jgi:hypothetical protein